jgi:putative endonuclease
MVEPDRFFVYILSSYTRVLYIGSTIDIKRRILEHKQKAFPGFTAKYNVDRLVHLEEYVTRLDASNRERELKGWTRKKKICLIEETNPDWHDLSLDWFDSRVAKSNDRTILYFFFLFYRRIIHPERSEGSCLSASVVDSQ